MDEVFISMAKKQTVMCLCGVTGCSGHVDRTLQSVLPELHVVFPLWNLTGVDRTLGLSVRSTLTGHVRS